MGCRKEPFILTHIPFLCVTHARPISVFEPMLGPAISRFVFAVLAISNYITERGTGSPFCFDDKIDLVTACFSLFYTEAFLFAHNQIVSFSSTAVPDSLTLEL